MVVNIVDERTNKFNVLCNVIFEPAYLDNEEKGATKHIRDTSKRAMLFAGILIVEALERGSTEIGSYTLRLYDAVNCTATRPYR